MLQRVLSQLFDQFSPSVMLEGMHHVQNDGLLSTRLSDGLLHARVKGEKGRLYDVYADLKTWPKTPSRCSCDMQRNCVHAAASFLGMRLKAEHLKTSKGLVRLDEWIKSVEALPMADDKPIQTHFLFYKLQFHARHVDVSLAIGKKLKNGNIGKQQDLVRFEQVKAHYLQDEDEAILARLQASQGQVQHQALFLSILKTGRAWHAGLSLPWELGEGIEGEMVWQVAEDGSQHWDIVALNQNAEICLLDMPIYVDKSSLQAGPLHLPYCSSSIQLMMEASSHDSPLNAQDLPQPYDLMQAVMLEVSPKPVFSLDVKERMGVMFLDWDYDGIRVCADKAQEKYYKQMNALLYYIQRDEAFEVKFKKEASAQFNFPWAGFDYENEALLEQLHQRFIPWVLAKGGQIEFKSDAYARVLDEDEVQWYSDLDEKNDFFSYELGISVDGKRVNLLPILLELLEKHSASEWARFESNHVFHLNLGNYQILPLKLERIKPLIDFLYFEGQGRKKTSDKLKLKRYQWVIMQSALAALEASLKREWSDSQLLKGLSAFVSAQALPKTPLPETFQATLRDYQQQGLDWLQQLRHCGLSGILADDMGLGKTIQTLAHLSVEKAAERMNGPCLIITPLSLIGNWEAEIERFSPSLRTLVYHGADRQAACMSDFDIVISTYGLVQRDQHIFLKQPFYYLVLDEAQVIKNTRAQITMMIQRLQASYRLCLSGTPFENHLGELWSLFHFVMPGLLLDKTRFKQHFREPIEKHGDEAKKTLLMRRVQPFLLRRTKKDVAKELPEKNVMIRRVSLAGEQRDLYEVIRLSMEKRVRDSIAKHGMIKSQMVVLDALLKLRQVCCDPRLLKLPVAKAAYASSAKLEALMLLLESLIEEGRHVLIFSQFTSMLALIEAEIQSKGYEYLKLTGQTSNRQALVDTFQEGNIPIFLMSLKAGGVGLNLTRADTVIHYDPWWNPAVEAQATDRTHRYGQTHRVFVYRFVAEGTVEEVMMQMQARKKGLFEGLLSEQTSGGMGWSEEDVASFFLPLEKTDIA